MSEFGLMIEREIPYLRRYARALLRDTAGADDLVQGCLERALAKQHLWQPGSNLRGWLFAILHNRRVSEVRRAAREERALNAVQLTAAIPLREEPGAWGRLLDLDRALRRLPEAQRAVVLLIGLEGVTYGEAAMILGVPLGTVRSRFSRAREALRCLVEDAPLRPLAAAASAGRGIQSFAGTNM